MHQLPIKIGFFFTGVLLAAAVLYVYRSSQSLEAGNLELSASEVSIDSELTPPSRARLVTPQNVPQQEPVASVGIEVVDVHLTPARELASYRPDERLSILRNAVRVGDIDSLQLVRREHLSLLPDYETTVLPELVQPTLDSLADKFQKSDWRRWPDAAVANRGAPSPARLFVDDLWQVNPDLATHAETAALLMHRLYVATSIGEVYDAERDFEEVLALADVLLSRRVQSHVPARALLTRDVLRAPAFPAFFEHLRGELVLGFIKNNPESLEAHFRLIASLNPRLVSDEVHFGISQLIARVAVEGTVRFREKIFVQELRTRMLQAFAEQSPRVRKTLAEFYVVGAVDALEHGDAELASEFLKESYKAQPGIPLQRVVEKHLRAGGKETSFIPDIDNLDEAKEILGSRETAPQVEDDSQVDQSSEVTTGSKKQSFLDSLRNRKKTAEKSPDEVLDSDEEFFDESPLRSAHVVAPVFPWGRLVIVIVLGIVGFIVFRKKPRDRLADEVAPPEDDTMNFNFASELKLSLPPEEDLPDVQQVNESR